MGRVARGGGGGGGGGVCVCVCVTINSSRTGLTHRKRKKRVIWERPGRAG